MTEKLTKRFIDNLAYTGDGTARDIRWDDDITGFGIRLSAKPLGIHLPVG